MENDFVDIAANYYKALGDKDLAGMDKCLHPQVLFVGPLAEVVGKEGVLAAAKKLFAMFSGLTVRAMYASPEGAMVAYDIECQQPIGVSRAASLLSFKDGLIARMELFYDARPFEKREIFK